MHEAATESCRDEVVGQLQPVRGPFGPKPLVYADWTASGRAVHTVETFVSEHVLPLYGNTHTTTSATGRASTALREDARRVIAASVNARENTDMVLFAGSGSTGAVLKFLSILGIGGVGPGVPPERRPVIFTSSYEHHSNVLPWRESGADVVPIEYASDTGVSLEHLEQQLELYRDRPIKA